MAYSETRAYLDKEIMPAMFDALRNLDAVKDCPVVVLACPNCPQSLDPALKRRFPRTMLVGKPTRDERYDILRKLVEGEEGDTLAKVADATDGHTGASLAALFARASALRMDAAPELDAAEDGHDLLARLGPLTWDGHWSKAVAE